MASTHGSRRGSSGDHVPVDREAERQLDVAALAKLIRDRRTSSNMSLRQAAADAQVSFMTLARIESGSQPDLATFLRLCAWLRTPPEEFFLSGPHRQTSTVEAVTKHLVTDPSLDRDAAERIAAVVRDMYSALARQPSTPAAVACHLRAASTLRPGVSERLAKLLEDMHSRLDELASKGAL